MEDIKQKLYNMAIEKHTEIFPCGGKENFDDCYTKQGTKLFFWFNTADENTHSVNIDYKELL